MSPTAVKERVDGHQASESEAVVNRHVADAITAVHAEQTGGSETLWYDFSQHQQSMPVVS